MGPKPKPAADLAEIAHANGEIVGESAIANWDRSVEVDADAYVRWMETGEGDDPCPAFSE